MLCDKDWWNDEVRMPGVLIATKVAALHSFIQGDAPVPGGPSSSNALPAAANAIVHPPSLAARVDGNPRKQQRTGVFTTNRTGTRLCAAFNQGCCTASTSNNACPHDPNARHQCSICLQVGHGAHQCNADAASFRTRNANRNQRDSKGKGKGKGGKDKPQDGKKKKRKW